MLINIEIISFQFYFQRKSPDEYGNINLYFPSPSKGGKKKKTQKMRFPVHRFDRKRARMYLFITPNFEIEIFILARFSPLLSFLPWLPIFADRLTKQTIIYSPTGGSKDLSFIYSKRKFILVC